MAHKQHRWIGICVGIWIFAGMLLCLFLQPQDISVSERRKLAKQPELTWGAITDGTYMKDYEAFLLDQFPFREWFRRGKAVSEVYLFQKKDQNDVYFVEGYASKIEYPLSETSVVHGAEKIIEVYNAYLKNTEVKVYYGLIPDKNYFLAEKNGYPALPYEKLEGIFDDALQNRIDGIQKIDFSELLTIEDYYKTDIHWKQENISQVARLMAERMGTEAFSKEELEWKELGPFYGVYYGQAALPMEEDILLYGTNEAVEQCQVFHYENGKTTGVYDLEKGNGLDRYDFFLSGADALSVIETGKRDTGRELIVFRDSFSSSLVPYLIKGYDRITLVDLRYIHWGMLDQFLTFENQDVLFLYNTILINNSTSLK